MRLAKNHSQHPEFIDKNNKFREMNKHPDIIELSDIELRMLRNKASPPDIERYNELKSKPPYLNSHIFILKDLLEDFKKNDKLYGSLISSLEEEISECEMMIKHQKSLE